MKKAPTATEQATSDWLASLAQPKSLTDATISYRRVDDETLVERKADEIRRIAKIKAPDLPISESWIDTTPERIARAEEAGLLTPVSDILSPNGFQTGVKYRKIDSPIDVAQKKHWISDRHWAAGEKFMIYLYGAHMEPRMIANLQAPVDGKSTPSTSNYRSECRSEINQALLCLPQKLRDPWLTWCGAILWKNIGVADLGAYFSRAKHPPALLRMGKIKLAEILELLAKHYGL